MRYIKGEGDVPDGILFEGVAHMPSILDAYPDACLVEGAPNSVFIPASYDNLSKLVRDKIPIPSRLDGEYSWPRAPNITRPHTAQKVMMQFFVDHPRCFCLSEMRTGKTLSSLWAADYLMHKGVGPFLIICPLLPMSETWVPNIKAHLLRRKVQVLHGTKKARLAALKESADFYVINPDGVEVIMDELYDHPCTKNIILDESTSVKNARTARGRNIQKISRRADIVWAMTGTPTASHGLDAYGQALVVNNALGKSFISFRKSIMTQVGLNEWTYKTDAAKKIADLLTPSIRFTQEDCFDAADLSIEYVEASMSGAQQAAYKDLRSQAKTMFDCGASLSVQNELALRSKLLQIAAGVVYLSSEDRIVKELHPTPKLEALAACIENSPGKVIVFSNLTCAIHMLESYLSKRWKCAVVNGELSKTESSKRLRDFQFGESRVLIANPGPVSRGLDLTVAGTIIWFAPTDKAEEYTQANERINGPNQKNSRTIVHLLCSKAERAVYEALVKKEKLQSAVLKLIEG